MFPFRSATAKRVMEKEEKLKQLCDDYCEQVEVKLTKSGRFIYPIEDKRTVKGNGEGK